MLARPGHVVSVGRRPARAPSWLPIRRLCPFCRERLGLFSDQLVGSRDALAQPGALTRLSYRDRPKPLVLLAEDLTRLLQLLPIQKGGRPSTTTLAYLAG